MKKYEIQCKCGGSEWSHYRTLSEGSDVEFAREVFALYAKTSSLKLRLIEWTSQVVPTGV